MIRLQKYMSEAGYCSRRKAEQLILEGRVTVDGKRAAQLGTKVDEEHVKVAVDGKVLKRSAKKIYILLNKPRGVLTTVTDDRGRTTVTDLLDGVEVRVYPVGRLDYDSRGMLVLTNDGEFAYRLTHPKHQIAKTYIAKLDKPVSETDLKKLERGIVVEDYKAVAKEARIISVKQEKPEVLITITQGKNRQIRKMFETIGYLVTDLKRISIGDLKLGKLAEGKWRYLKKTECEMLERHGKIAFTGKRGDRL